LQQSPGEAGKEKNTMNRQFPPLMNEGGSVIVFTLMVLVLLTIVGLVSIRTAGTEIEIAGTELKYQRNFYLAEGAAMEAVRILDNDTTMTATTGPSWIDMTGAINWGHAQACTLDADASFIAVYEGLAEGSSLDVNKTKLHDITIYGRSRKSGEARVQLGYRKAF
jgi:Tfp pilus assembly protein PilX